jgi:hypothetical protein
MKSEKIFHNLCLRILFIFSTLFIVSCSTDKGHKNPEEFGEKLFDVIKSKDFSSLTSFTPTKAELVTFGDFLIATNEIEEWNENFKKFGLMNHSKSFDLSAFTKKVLNTLESEVRVNVYISTGINDHGINEHIDKVKIEVLELLIEASRLSNGLVSYQMIDVSEDDASRKRAYQAGIEPLDLTVRNSGVVSNKTVFAGLEIIGKNTKTLQLFGNDLSIESVVIYEIAKMEGFNSSRIGFLEGHGEANLESLARVRKQLQYHVLSTVNLTDGADELMNYKVLVMIAPTKQFSPAEFKMLDGYLDNGGRLVITYSHVISNFDNLRIELNKTNLSSWLENKGLLIEDKVVVDKNAATVGVREQTGFMTFTRQIPFPYFPSITEFSNTSITSGISQIFFQFPSPMNYVDNNAYSFIPIISSSNLSGTIQIPHDLDLSKDWSQKDFGKSSQTIGAILEQNVNSALQSKIIIFTDGEFATENIDGHARYYENINLLVRSIEYASGNIDPDDLKNDEENLFLLNDLVELDNYDETMQERHQQYFNYLHNIGIHYGIDWSSVKLEKIEVNNKTINNMEIADIYINLSMDKFYKNKKMVIRCRKCIKISNYWRLLNYPEFIET